MAVLYIENSVEYGRLTGTECAIAFQTMQFQTRSTKFSSLQQAFYCLENGFQTPE